MQLLINGQKTEVSDTPGQLLLWALRDELGLTGTKFGCGAGICGACAVHVDGKTVRACITPLASVAGKEITTIEGLAQETETGRQLHPVQQAFLDVQVPQCSWCMSGQMMTAAAFLADNPAPSEEEIVQAMGQNYCRCGCYFRIKQAVTQVAQEMNKDGAKS